MNTSHTIPRTFRNETLFTNKRLKLLYHTAFPLWSMNIFPSARVKERVEYARELKEGERRTLHMPPVSSVVAVVSKTVTINSKPHWYKKVLQRIRLKKIAFGGPVTLKEHLLAHFLKPTRGLLNYSIISTVVAKYLLSFENW